MDLRDNKKLRNVSADALAIAAGSITAAAIQSNKVNAADYSAVADYFNAVLNWLSPS